MRSDLVTKQPGMTPVTPRLALPERPGRSERPGQTSTAACAPAERGYVQVYTGEGKGKTTAAFGLALRAAGHGKRVFIGQFMKSQPSGEVAALSPHSQIKVEQFGSPGCMRRDEATSGHLTDASRGLARASAALVSGDYDLVVLDELDVAVLFGLLSDDDCAKLIESRPPQVELVITGRSAPRAVLDRADLVTEMREIRHYYRRGVVARAGIEF
jgi:cob(I)alamin adenosyltransferase